MYEGQQVIVGMDITVPSTAGEVGLDFTFSPENAVSKIVATTIASYY